MGTTSYRSTAIRILVAQTLVTVIATLGLYLWSGSHGAISALSGGMICVISGAYLALKMFKVNSNKPPAQWVRAFYVGEAVKLVLTALLFFFAIVIFEGGYPDRDIDLHGSVKYVLVCIAGNS